MRLLASLPASLKVQKKLPDSRFCAMCYMEWGLMWSNPIHRCKAMVEGCVCYHAIVGHDHLFSYKKTCPRSLCSKCGFFGKLSLGWSKKIKQLLGQFHASLVSSDHELVKHLLLTLTAVPMQYYWRKFKVLILISKYGEYFKRKGILYIQIFQCDYYFAVFYFLTAEFSFLMISFSE